MELSAYEILKSIVAEDTVLIYYDLKGSEKRMFVNLLSLKTGMFLNGSASVFMRCDDNDTLQHSFRPRTSCSQVP